MPDIDRVAFIRQWTQVVAPPLVPELRLHLAAESIPIWEALERMTGVTNPPPPYWAFCWPGGQALSRYVLDRPDLIRDRRVLDFAAGGGVVAIAAATVGAASCLATEIDVFAIDASTLNASENTVEIAARAEDVVGRDDGWDVVCAGDVCYERPMAERVFAWLRTLAARGALVLLGDPGRNYLPSSGLEALAEYTVPTSVELENRATRVTKVWRVLG